MSDQSPSRNSRWTNPSRALGDPRLVQGLGRCFDDVSLPRRPYAVVLRSPHARIRGIDPAAALRAGL